MAVFGSSFLCEGFLQLRQAGATLHRGAQASHYRGLSCCRAQSPDVQAQQLWLTGLVAPQHVGSSQTRARTRVSCIGRQILNHCATREALKEFLQHQHKPRWGLNHTGTLPLLDKTKRSDYVVPSGCSASTASTSITLEPGGDGGRFEGLTFPYFCVSDTLVRLDFILQRKTWSGEKLRIVIQDNKHSLTRQFISLLSLGFTYQPFYFLFSYLFLPDNTNFGVRRKTRVILG